MVYIISERLLTVWHSQVEHESSTREIVYACPASVTRNTLRALEPVCKEESPSCVCYLRGVTVTFNLASNCPFYNVFLS